MCAVHLQVVLLIPTMLFDIRLAAVFSSNRYCSKPVSKIDGFWRVHSVRKSSDYCMAGNISCANRREPFFTSSPHILKLGLPRKTNITWMLLATLRLKALSALTNTPDSRIYE